VVHDNKVYIGVGSNPEDGPRRRAPLVYRHHQTGDLSPVNDNFDPKAAVNKDSGLVWHYGRHDRAQTGDGRDYRFGRTLSTCAVHDGLVYVAEPTVPHCLDANTGKNTGSTTSRGAWGSASYAAASLMGTGDGDISSSPTARRRSCWRRTRWNKPLKEPPVVAGGVMYVLTGTRTWWAIAAGK